MKVTIHYTSYLNLTREYYYDNIGYIFSGEGLFEEFEHVELIGASCAEGFNDQFSLKYNNNKERAGARNALAKTINNAHMAWHRERGTVPCDHVDIQWA